MPYIKRKPFVPNPPPSDLKGEEEVFYLRLTNEVFRDYDDYFAQVIQCNSLIWSCSLTGKSGLTFQEAIESEKSAKKLLKGFPRPLKKALFYLAALTKRGKFTDLVEDVLTYARERYFKGEEVFSVIGNMWCPSKVIRIISPTPVEVEQYRKEQIEKGLEGKNDYLTDDSWGHAPDLYRYEVQEIDPEDKTPASSETHILEAIDVKREKTILTRDKCRVLLKLATDMIEEKGLMMVKPSVMNSYGLLKAKYDDLFIGKPPLFEESAAPVKTVKDTPKSKSKPPKEPKKEKTGTEKEKIKKEPAEKKAKNDVKEKKTSSTTNKTPTGGSKKPKAKPEPKPKKPKVEKQLTPQEIKQLELEKKAKEREKLKEQKKLVADFKKLWFKPKEDLEVEDLKDLPVPDPVCCKIPNNLFGEFMMVLEFMHLYSSTLKVRDCFSNGVTFDILERALTKNEVAGPFSEILQVLMKTIFRLQETENAEITEEETATVDFEVNDVSTDVTAREAVQLATAYSTWSMMYQNTPLHKLGVDHLSITEVLRLHLLSSGAKPSEKDVKWRNQQRGGYTETDDPGLQLRLEEPQIIKTLSAGTVFDLTMREKLKLVQCLINQVSTYVSVRDAMEENFDQCRITKAALKTLQAAEKKKDAEDNYWRTKLKADKLMPDMTLFKAVAEKPTPESQDGENGKGKEKPPEKPSKPLMTDEQIEAALAKKDKEIARRKQDFLWKEVELQEKLQKHERRIGLHPYGRDRAFRRYWGFQTVAGLFVEHDDEHVGECPPAPTPYLANVDFDDMTFVKETYNKYLQIDKEGSDKENSISTSPKKSKKKASMSSVVKKEAPERPPCFGICTGDKESCPVHCIYLPRPKWSFFWNPEHIDALIENLSPRGIREKDLRTALVEEKDALKNYVNKCPALKLNREGIFPEHIANAPDKRPSRGGTTQKNRIDPNLSYPAGTNIEIILELQLRDLILEVEEKIFLGALGSVKVGDRAVWRKAIEDREYDPQATKLSWATGKSINVAKRRGKLNGNSAEEGTSKSDQQSTHTSTSSEANKDDSTSLNPIIKDLACAILQIRQSIEPKFLKRPLGADDDPKKKFKVKDSELSSKLNLPAPTAIERWELSLMACTSFSQLFVHLFTFDNSVEWSRSVLNARCRVCRRKGNPENMLLCDGCNKGHHAYCLKPPLEIIPKGDWFCYDCKPIEPPPKPRSRARRLSDDDILDELERNDSDGDDLGRRGGARHSNDLTEEVEQEGCAVCSFGGELMCCDGCPDMYHLLCLNPPLSRVPRGSWHCPNCKSQAQKGRSSSGSKKKGRRTISTDESDEEDTLRSDEESEQGTSSRSRNALRSSEEETDRGTDDESDKSTDDEREVVKVKFAKRTTERTNIVNRKRVFEDDYDSDDDDEEYLGRGGRRKCASLAAAKITQVAKRLRSDSKENESSDNSNDSSSSGFQVGSRNKRPSELDMYDSDVPKRTRLQRMNTNNCVRNGELDNVLLDKILSEVMKQAEAWPFLKPVTRNEAPDYHEIVKHPMDLGTIKYKLNSMVYTCNEEFISDLLLVFSNCEMYNDPSSRIHQAGRTLKTFCERKFSKIGIQISDS
ncbi:unnamed protein product [Orchesella dallaii]|uniref:Bromodomain adjacent to zinc finger domain protein 1A n=1 Tax=Orchesella dallaii TaxID=48710 RepID=A0ABP1PWY5_9HEXA